MQLRVLNHSQLVSHFQMSQSSRVEVQQLPLWFDDPANEQQANPISTTI